MSSDFDSSRQENAAQIQQALEDLRRDFNDGRYREFWTQVKVVSGLFKTLKPLGREDRGRLWEEFGSLCQDAKQQREQTQEHRQRASHQKRELVMSKLNDTYYQVKGATSGSDLRTASSMLAEALSWMKPGWSQVSLGDDLGHLNDGRLTREDHDACWEKYKEVRETLDWKRREFQQAWEERQETERSRRVDRISKAKDVIRRLEDQISDLEYKVRDARTSEFADRVQGWIDEKRDKIRDIEASIDRDEEVIADIDRRLRN